MAAIPAGRVFRARWNRDVFEWKQRPHGEEGRRPVSNHGQGLAPWPSFETQPKEVAPQDEGVVLSEITKNDFASKNIILV